MRRVLALLASMALVVSVAGSSVAAGSELGTSRFAGSFDFYAGDQLVGHINALLRPTTDSQPFGGSYSTSGPGGRSVALPTEVVFHHFATVTEVWFNALEVSVGQEKAAFTGHFVDYFDPSTPDVVEFWGRHVAPVTAPGAFEFDVSYDFAFTVGKGFFVLVVR